MSQNDAIERYRVVQRTDNKNTLKSTRMYVKYNILLQKEKGTLLRLAISEWSKKQNKNDDLRKVELKMHTF